MRAEVDAALKDFHPNESPEKDVTHVMFLQKYWNIIGDEASQLVLKPLNN